MNIGTCEINKFDDKIYTKNNGYVVLVLCY